MRWAVRVAALFGAGCAIWWVVRWWLDGERCRWEPSAADWQRLYEGAARG